MPGIPAWQSTARLTRRVAGADFAAFLRAEHDRLGKLIKERRISAD